jgi:hypothetical protein
MAEWKLQPEMLSAYLDGELSAAQRRQVEQALSADANLSRELARLRALRQVMRSLPRHQAPASLAERVLQRSERLHLVKRTTGQGVRGFRWSNLVAAAIILVALGLAASMIGPLTHPQTFDKRMADKQGSELVADAYHRAPGPVEPTAPADRPEKPESLAMRGSAGPAPLADQPAGAAGTRLQGRELGAPLLAEAAGNAAAESAAVDGTNVAGLRTPLLANTRTTQLVVAGRDLDRAQGQLETALKAEGVRLLVASNDVVLAANNAAVGPGGAANMSNQSGRVVGNYLVYGTPSQLGRLRGRLTQVQSQLSPPAPGGPTMQDLMTAALEAEESRTVHMPAGPLATAMPAPAALLAPVAPTSQPTAGNRSGAFVAAQPATQPAGVELAGGTAASRSGNGTILSMAAPPAGESAPAETAAVVRERIGGPINNLATNQAQARALSQIWSFAVDEKDLAGSSQRSPALEPMLIMLVSADQPGMSVPPTESAGKPVGAAGVEGVGAAPPASSPAAGTAPQ